jgi:hypothetical protein
MLEEILGANGWNFVYLEHRVCLKCDGRLMSVLFLINTEMCESHEME